MARPCQLLLALLSGMFLLSSEAAQAGSSTWKLVPLIGDWNSATNWTPSTVPNGPTDVATFGVSNKIALIISADTTVGSIVFNPGASAFAISALGPPTLTVSGVGIVNNSGVVQIFVCDSALQLQRGLLSFTGNASAGSLSVFTAGNLLGGGMISFFDQATAGNSTFVAIGSGIGASVPGLVNFFDNSSAANCTLTVTGGVNSAPGGQVRFENNSVGGTARVILSGNGSLDISNHAGELTVGSVAGDGVISLGARNLALGSNNLSTALTASIEDGGRGGGTGGSISKVGTGTLTLSGANTYTGGTTVSAGTLMVANSEGSGTGPGAVTVTAGTLGGSGTITGPVAIATGAFLAPAGETNVQTTLNIASSLTFSTNSTYTYTFKAKKKKAKADTVVASGVTISSGATINLSGQIQGGLALGVVLDLIRNNAKTPIAGRFANLAEGAIVSMNGNTFQASYSGGDGNDLTLTVIPLAQ